MLGSGKGRWKTLLGLERTEFKLSIRTVQVQEPWKKLSYWDSTLVPEEDEIRKNPYKSLRDEVRSSKGRLLCPLLKEQL